MDQESSSGITGLENQQTFQQGKTRELAENQRVLVLAQALTESNSSVRRHAAEELFHHAKSPTHFKIMGEAVCSDDPLVAEIAVYALERYGEAAVDTLISKLDYCNCLVKLTIVAALERIGSRKAVLPLLQILQSTTYASLRYVIIQTLGTLKDARAIDLIQLFVDDSDPHVAKRAYIALEKLRSTSPPYTSEMLNFDQR